MRKIKILIFILVLTNLITPVKAAVSSNIHYLLINKASGTDRVSMKDVKSTLNIDDENHTLKLGVQRTIDYFDLTRDQAETKVRQSMDMAEQENMSVVFRLDGFTWWDQRPDLWKWWDPNISGEESQRRTRNVEWTSWSSNNAIQKSWREWYQVFEVKPHPNLGSRDYIAAKEAELDRLIPIIKNWYGRLPQDKKYLFAGIMLDSELSIGVNYFVYEDENNVTLGKGIASGAKVKQLGYAAASSFGIKYSGTLTQADLDEVVKRHAEELANYVKKFNLPEDKIFIHGGGNFEGKLHQYNAIVTNIVSPAWTLFESETFNQAQNQSLNRALDENRTGAWAAAEWTLNGYPGNYDLYLKALRNTLNLKGNDMLIYYNWEDIKKDPAALQAINTVIDESPLINPDAAVQSPQFTFIDPISTCKDTPSGPQPVNSFSWGKQPGTKKYQILKYDPLTTAYVYLDEKFATSNDFYYGDPTSTPGQTEKYRVLAITSSVTSPQIETTIVTKDCGSPTTKDLKPFNIVEGNIICSPKPKINFSWQAPNTTSFTLYRSSDDGANWETTPLNKTNSFSSEVNPNIKFMYRILAAGENSQELFSENTYSPNVKAACQNPGQAAQNQPSQNQPSQGTAAPSVSKDLTKTITDLCSDSRPGYGPDQKKMCIDIANRAPRDEGGCTGIDSSDPELKSCVEAAKEYVVSTIPPHEPTFVDKFPEFWKTVGEQCSYLLGDIVNQNPKVGQLCENAAKPCGEEKLPKDKSDDELNQTLISCIQNKASNVNYSSITGQTQVRPVGSTPQIPTAPQVTKPSLIELVINGNNQPNQTFYPGETIELGVNVYNEYLEPNNGCPIVNIASSVGAISIPMIACKPYSFTVPNATGNYTFSANFAGKNPLGEANGTLDFTVSDQATTDTQIIAHINGGSNLKLASDTTSVNVGGRLYLQNPGICLIHNISLTLTKTNDENGQDINEEVFKNDNGQNCQSYPAILSGPGKYRLDVDFKGKGTLKESSGFATLEVERNPLIPTTTSLSITEGETLGISKVSLKNNQKINLINLTKNKNVAGVAVKQENGKFVISDNPNTINDSINITACTTPNNDPKNTAAILNNRLTIVRVGKDNHIVDTDYQDQGNCKPFTLKLTDLENLNRLEVTAGFVPEPDSKFAASTPIDAEADIEQSSSNTTPESNFVDLTTSPSLKTDGTKWVLNADKITITVITNKVVAGKKPVFEIVKDNQTETLDAENNPQNCQDGIGSCQYEVTKYDLGSGHYKVTFCADTNLCKTIEFDKKAEVLPQESFLITPDGESIPITEGETLPIHLGGDPSKASSQLFLLKVNFSDGSSVTRNIPFDYEPPLLQTPSEETSPNLSENTAPEQPQETPATVPPSESILSPADNQCENKFYLDESVETGCVHKFSSTPYPNCNYFESPETYVVNADFCQ